MDPLSDLVTILKPHGFLTLGLDAGGAWALRFDNQAGRIKCYAVTVGACWLTVEGNDDAIKLVAGDCFVLPSGLPFVLASDPALVPSAAHDVLLGDRGGGVVTYNGGGGMFLAASRFEVDGREALALLAALPAVVCLKSAQDRAALRWSIDRMMDEIRAERPGAALAAHHLAHIMLLQTLRLCLDEQPHGGVGLLQALANPRLGAAIAAMHAEPAHRWTLAELAVIAGLSRSIFAKRFQETVGETPIAYLTRWRMMLAGNRLNSHREPLVKVAEAVGYASEDAFSAAFKRVTGRSPRCSVRRSSQLESSPRR